MSYTSVCRAGRAEQNGTGVSQEIFKFWREIIFRTNFLKIFPKILQEFFKLPCKTPFTPKIYLHFQKALVASGA